MGINTANIPESYLVEGYQLTSLEKAIGLARANSIWPLPFATSCCGSELGGLILARLIDKGGCQC